MDHAVALVFSDVAANHDVLRYVVMQDVKIQRFQALFVSVRHEPKVKQRIAMGGPGFKLKTISVTPTSECRDREA
ncbi:hypothetical protein EV186_106331 [Labedaea rhizosphaerae]|uniref:Uncharacterized protein n=1 Tax=Labedaea rhizosphaerae TaxID=598644 RepID=A0A4R6S4C4_LABRH|nr:hypothetical protein EV186_106331 [Labedaea rhizosphaerae]